MAENFETPIKEICKRFGKDRTRMMDVVRAIHEELGHVSGDMMELIAKECSTHRVEVESVVSFYSFYSEEPKGKVVIRLCNDTIDKMYGMERVAKAFEEEAGIAFGETTADGLISLEYTPCIGMCDQPPAAMVGKKVMTWLSSDQARQIVASIREHGNEEHIHHTLGDGNNGHELVKSMVFNNIREKGPVIFGEFESGSSLRKAFAMSPVEVIKQMKVSRLRGRGGAGFPAGMKWEFTRASQGERKYVVCNADEGEPGTFKDRVILTERPDLLFEGMTIAGYAIGACEGILYLRGEYEYLYAFLQKVLSDRRSAGLLGKDVGGKKGFDFDIRIQLGAGAYVCGEETSLLSSCEGTRGDPKNRPPFPAQKGYMGMPTSVNNVETLCCVARILDKGAAWFAEIGTPGSSGTKLLSVSGDCKSPGVYELPFGVTLKDLLAKVGAENAIAVQVGGPSGKMVGPADFGRKVCFDDLATGGSVMVFGPNRDVLKIAKDFMEFFVHESCGYCTPCRVGNRLMLERLDKIIDGRGEEPDLDYLKVLGEEIKAASRCGLGQTSPNPVLTSLDKFRDEYLKRVKKADSGLRVSFNFDKALAVSEKITGRRSSHHSG